MQRRSFLTLLSTSAAAAWPFSARAQQVAVPVIGWLNGTSPGGPYVGYVAAFLQGLRETGFVDGRNVAIEYRWAHDQPDRLAALADELVRNRVSVIFANTPAALPAKRATTTTPIVFYTAIDPVENGLVGSLNRPGGNVTGVSGLNTEVGPKRLELLHELLPKSATMALLVNPTNPVNVDFNSRGLREAARILGLQLHVLHASTERDFDTVFATLAQLRADGLVIGPDPLFVSRTESLAALALRHAVPTIFQYREFTQAGGLMSYGSSITDGYRLAGVYTGRILKGENPASLPVQQATKIELIVNMKTAKALGLTFPTTILVRADEVIE
jgi:putative ABC transport system substrate-binding protein